MLGYVVLTQGGWGVDASVLPGHGAGLQSPACKSHVCVQNADSEGFVLCLPEDNRSGSVVGGYVKVD